MQVKITDNNDWEGESFSFVLEIPEDLAFQIERQQTYDMDVELNTNYQLGDIERINSISDNGYMSRIQFADIKDYNQITPGIDFYNEIFYKGIGLKLSIDGNA